MSEGIGANWERGTKVGQSLGANWERGTKTGQALGAVVLERDIRGLGADTEASTASAPTAITTDAITGELIKGIAVSAAGGAVVGGLAAGSSKGALIGAGINTAIWSLMTLSGVWSVSNTTTKAILGGAIAAGGGLSGYLIYKRMK